MGVYLDNMKLAREIAESGFVENSPKQEYDFDIEWVNTILKENEILINANDEFRYVNTKLRNIVKEGRYTRMRKHIYKVEMERLRRKLTRLYEVLAIMHDNECLVPDVDTLKKI